MPGCCPLFFLLHNLHKSRDLLLIAYREGYGGTSTRLYGGGTCACYQTVRRLSSLTLCNPTPVTTTTTTAAAPAAAAAFFKYHSLITLSLSMRLRPLLLTYSRYTIFISFSTHETIISLQRRKFLSFPSTPLATLLLFKSPAGGEGSHVTQEVEGVILLLKKSLPPLG